MNNNVVFFSEYFWINSDDNNQHDFFDIVLDMDLPIFIDPFLIFCSDKKEYQELYSHIINYLKFLTEKSILDISKAEFKQYYYFQEVQETHIWFSLQWNPWKGLWNLFWHMLIRNLRSLFIFPENNSHLEKLCIIADGVWKDKISDFTINLIKDYLADYTSKIASNIEDKSKVQEFTVRKAYFDFERKIWRDKKYILPKINWNYVLLIPKDILTTWETWINKKDFYERIYELGLPDSISNDELRFQFNNIMSEDLSKSEKIKEIKRLIKSDPLIIEDYIKFKEENSGNISNEAYQSLINVKDFINPEKVNSFTSLINEFTLSDNNNSYKEAISLVNFFKDTIENKWVWKEFWLENNNRVQEKTVQNLFKLTWRWSKFYIASEVNQWTWPVDFIVSKWSEDVTVIEFKLASNPKAIPVNQVESYKKANTTKNGLIVVFCFTEEEIENVNSKIQKNKVENICVIDVTPKKSASNL